MVKVFSTLAACSGFLSVALGAFGAHALKARLSEDMLAVFETGVRYQMFHTLALLAVALGLNQWSQNALRISGWLFTVGIVIFSGSLYLLALTGVKKWGAVTPIGGLAFLIGWGCLAWGVVTIK